MLKIGIDPGTQKSGVSIMEGKQVVKLMHLPLWDVFALIAENKEAEFFVENSNLVKGNWHGKTARAQVGKNKSISQNIIDYCKHTGVKLHELKPKGYSQAFADVKTFTAATKCTLRSNEHNRAATAMILFNSP